MMRKKIVVTASIFGVLAVIAGAFGAHGLEGAIAPKYLEAWKTGVEYQFYHVFALLFLSTLTRFKTRLIKETYYLFTLGIIFFSGSLYLISVHELLYWNWLMVLGPLTPLGGLLFIAGWITLGIAAYKTK